MKKLLIAMAALMTLAFIGCEKEEEPATDALTGTTWESSYGGTPLAVSFNAGGIVTLNMGSETYTGTYTYKAPNVAIQMPIDGRNVAFTGTYSNGTLNISSSEYGSFVFTQTGGPSPDGSDEADNPDNQSEMKYVKQVTLTVKYSDADSYTKTYTAEYDNNNRMVKIYEDSYWGGTFTYADNMILVEEPGQTNQKYILELNGDGYVSRLADDDGKIYIGHTYEDGYLVKREGDGQTETYTWQNGNMVAAAYSGRNNYSIQLKYDESKTLVPMNINVLYLFDIIRPIYDDYESVVCLDVWGRQSKSPLKQAAYGGEAAAVFTYEYYGDGSVAKINIDSNGEQVTAKFAYL